MKKIFSKLFGTKTANEKSAPEVQTIDVRAINYCMPTVAADEIHFEMPTSETFQGAPQFHEDEWCQIEFFPENRLSEIKSMLARYKPFEQKHRIRHGCSAIFARRIQRTDVVVGIDARSKVAAALGAEILPAPILTTTSSPLGQVKDGFSLRLPGSVLLYGLAPSGAITVLGASVGRGGDDMQLTKAFSVLNKEHGLMLVDWRSQLVLVSLDASGEVNVWRP
jgi:hypothetical protein